MKEGLYKYLLMLGDNSMILGHRLSELCGHGPSLETDIALTNISLDLFGEVRNYFQYAAEIAGKNATEDTIAFLRNDRSHFNVWLVEQPNGDFAQIIARQYLFDQYHHLLLTELVNSKDESIAAIASKSIKEATYHVRFSSQWVKRLGDGTEESKTRMQNALNEMYPFADELFKITKTEEQMFNLGIGADLNKIKTIFNEKLKEVLVEATLELPEIAPRMTTGKQGIHSEHLGFILSDFQYMQRAYPNLQW